MSNGVILNIKPVEVDWSIIDVTISDSWYYTPEYEKERFAETIGDTIKMVVRNSGKVGEDGVVSVYYYDSYGKNLASPKLLGGYKIQR